jgi:hypothetical protein
MTHLVHTWACAWAELFEIIRMRYSKLHFVTSLWKAGTPKVSQVISARAKILNVLASRLYQSCCTDNFKKLWSADLQMAKTRRVAFSIPQ